MGGDSKISEVFNLAINLGLFYESMMCNSDKSQFDSIPILDQIPSINSDSNPDPKRGLYSLIQFQFQFPRPWKSLEF